MKYLLIPLVVIIFSKLSYANNLTNNEVIELQQRLTAIGYPTLGADGVIGLKTTNATRLFLNKNKIEDGDLNFALDKLRKSQNGYIVLKTNKIEALEKDIKNIRDSNIKTQEYLEKIISSKVVASVSTAEVNVYKNILSYLLFVLAAIVGGGYIGYIRIKKHIEDKIKTCAIEKVDEEAVSIHKEIVDKSKTSTAESKFGDAELFADLSYIMWLLKKYFEKADTDAGLICGDLLIAQLKFAKRSVNNAESLQLSTLNDDKKVREYLKVMLRTYANALFYFANQKTQAREYYPKAEQIIKKIKPLIEKVEDEFNDANMIEDFNMLDIRESIISAEGKLKLADERKTKEDLDALFVLSGNDAWINEVKKRYPHIEWE